VAISRQACVVLAMSGIGPPDLFAQRFVRGTDPGTREFCGRAVAAYCNALPYA
jgi:hypothetical protein